MWQGQTIQEACEALGIEYFDVLRELNVQPEIKSFLLDVGLLANAREEILCPPSFS